MQYDHSIYTMKSFFSSRPRSWQPFRGIVRLIKLVPTGWSEWHDIFPSCCAFHNWEEYLHHLPLCTFPLSPVLLTANEAPNQCSRRGTPSSLRSNKETNKLCLVSVFPSWCSESNQFQSLRCRVNVEVSVISYNSIRWPYSVKHQPPNLGKRGRVFSQPSLSMCPIPYSSATAAWTAALRPASWWANLRVCLSRWTD